MGEREEGKVGGRLGGARRYDHCCYEERSMPSAAHVNLLLLLYNKQQPNVFPSHPTTPHGLALSCLAWHRLASPHLTRLSTVSRACSSAVPANRKPRQRQAPAIMFACACLIVWRSTTVASSSGRGSCNRAYSVLTTSGICGPRRGGGATNKIISQLSPFATDTRVNAYCAINRSTN